MKTVVAFDTFETPRLINLWPGQASQPSQRVAPTKSTRLRRRDAWTTWFSPDYFLSTTEHLISDRDRHSPTYAVSPITKEWHAAAHKLHELSGTI